MFKKIINCFDKAPVNLGRQRELDVAKGIFIIFMSFSHCIEILGWFFDPNSSVGASWHDFDMVIKSLVLVVISCMGISLCYSSRESAGSLFRRALGMLGVVILLEFSRTIIPCFIEWLIFRDFESIRYAYQFLSVDILQFVTLAFSVIALFKKLKLKQTTMLLISAFLSVIGQLLQGVSTGSFIGDIAVGYLWHSHDAAYFPLLNWLFALVIGYVFGHAYLHLRDKDTFYKIVTPISLFISVLYFVSMVLVGKWYYFSGECYCGIGLLDVIFMYAVFFAIAGTSYFVSRGLPRISHHLESMGIRISSIYCIHWVTYAFLYLILTCVMGNSFVPTWAVIPTAILVLIVADSVSLFYKKITSNRRNRENNK
jgi:uncharacterized membrane protein